MKNEQIIISIGKYTNSYRAHLGELATSGFTYRIARGHIDDTCFDEGETFYTVEAALTSLVQALEKAQRGDGAALEYAYVLSEALLESKKYEN